MGLIKYLIGEEPSIFEKLAFNIKHNSDVGAYGEYLTQYLFNSVRFKGYYKTLQNIYVPYKDSTSEIDVLVAHKKGIYVIESKNYSGWIFGSDNQQQWTQMLNKNTKERFYNPIRQNKTHIKALSEYLQIDSSKMKSYIVFSERCELKRVPENTDRYAITKRNYLLDLINKDIADKQDIFTNEEIDEIARKLEPLTNVSQEIKEKHIEDIEKKYKSQ